MKVLPLGKSTSNSEDTQESHMHPEFRAFLKLLRDSMQCSIDLAGYVHEYELDEGSVEVVGSLKVTHDEFFAQLYEPRDVVAQLSVYLGRSDNLMCLIGPRGSGKSTAILALEREVQKRGARRPWFMTVIDLRRERDTVLNFHNADALEVSLRNRLRSEYLRHLFPELPIKDNPRNKLRAFLLDATRRPQKQPPELFYDFDDLEDEVTRRLRIMKSSSVLDWIENSQDYPTVGRIMSDCDKNVKFTHLAHAAHHVALKGRQIVWFDNADVLTDQEQWDAVNVIRKVLAPVASLVHMGISIREENVYRDHEIWDDGAPPFERLVRIQMPRGAGGHAYFPSLDVRVETDGWLKSVIEKRLLFTQRYQSTEIKRLTEEISAIEPDDTLLRDDLTKELKQLTPQLSAKHFADLQLLVGKLLEAMIHDRMIFLANNSLREFMFMLRDCLGDLLKSNKPETTEQLERALGYERWYLSTLLFRRIRHTERRYQAAVHDVFAQSERWYAKGSTGPACMLSHLILTCTWNLLGEGKDDDFKLRRTPTVRDVEKRLEVIGYESHEIREQMFDLYTHNNRRWNLLELRTGRSMLPNPDDIEDGMKIYLTYRGKMLTASTSGTFGYLYDCLRLIEGGTRGEEAFADHPEMQEKYEATKRMLPRLCDIAQIHLATFEEWLRSGRQTGEDWLDRYKLQFGIPAVPPYRKRGDPLLLLEMVLMRLASHVSVGPEHDQLRLLLDKYQEEILKLGHASSQAEKPDFRALLGQSPRKVK